MRIAFVTSIMALLVASCAKEKPTSQQMAPVSFQISSNWTATERSAFDRLPSDLQTGLAWARSFPIYRARWQREIDSLHICLQYPGIELGGTPYSVFVFDDAGHLLEQSRITAPEDYVPKQVVGVSPFRVGFGHPSTSSSLVVRDLDFSTAEWRRCLMELAAEHRNRKDTNK